MGECIVVRKGGSGNKIKTGIITLAYGSRIAEVKGLGFQPNAVILMSCVQTIVKFDGTSRRLMQFNDGENEIGINTAQGGTQVLRLGGVFTPNSDGFTLTNFGDMPFVEGDFFWIAYK